MPTVRSLFDVRHAASEACARALQLGGSCHAATTAKATSKPGARVGEHDSHITWQHAALLAASARHGNATSNRAIHLANVEKNNMFVVSAPIFLASFSRPSVKKLPQAYLVLQDMGSGAKMCTSPSCVTGV